MLPPLTVALTADSSSDHRFHFFPVLLGPAFPRCALGLRPRTTQLVLRSSGDVIGLWSIMFRDEPVRLWVLAIGGTLSWWGNLSQKSRSYP